jgi:hypothetical protein
LSFAASCFFSAKIILLSRSPFQISTGVG